MRVVTSKNKLSAAVGNFLEHYDNALFGLLIPFIAPLFFVETDSCTPLIWTYAFLPLGFFTKPIGSLFFGWIGDTFGRQQALFYSLLGMALTSICMGSLPIYQELGILSPILLAFFRMCQSFFAAGEVTGAALFILENSPQSKKSLIGSLYDATSIGGILFASALVTLMSQQGLLLENWRWLFWGGSLTAIIGVFLRSKEISSTKPNQKKPLKLFQSFQILASNFQSLAKIIFVSGFSYTIYSISFTFINGYIPLISSISKTDVMKVNTLLLGINILLLPLFGYLADRFSKERVIYSGLLFSIATAIPLFCYLENSSLMTIFFIRLGFMLPGIAFAAPYYAWALEQIPLQHRYLFLSLGTALGSQLIGSSTASICFFLYQLTNWSGAPGIYLSLIGLLAIHFICGRSPFEFSFFKKNILRKSLANQRG